MIDSIQMQNPDLLSERNLEYVFTTTLNFNGDISKFYTIYFQRFGFVLQLGVSRSDFLKTFCRFLEIECSTDFL